MRLAWPSWLALASASFLAACGQPAASPQRTTLHSVAHPGKPPLALVVRAGDPATGVAAAIVTDGIAPARSTTVAWSLATLLAMRLPGESVVPASEGVRLRGRAHGAAEVTRFFTSVREALAAPVAAAEAEAVAHKLAATSGAPDAAAEISATCRGTALARSADSADSRGSAALDRATLESWRTDAYALGRVSLAVVGSDADAKAADDLLARDAAWPAEKAALKVDRAVVPGDQLYVRTAGTADILARVDVAVPTATSAEAVALARSLGAEGGALAARLGALDRPATLALVSATAHPGGGCVAVTVTVAANDVGGRPSDVDLAARIGSAVAVTTQEIEVEAARPVAESAAAVSPEELARREGDAREAADVAAWWTLADAVAPAAGSTKEHGARAERVAVGVTLDRDVGPGRDAAAGHEAAAAGTSLLARVGAEVDRARAASGATVAEVHSRVERGQGDTWVLVASPCAGVDEGSGDAGLAAAVALAESSAPAAGGADGVDVEPWTAIDGVGVIAHGHPRAGESPEASARRIADAAARRFAATPLGAGAIVRARSALFAAADTVTARALATVAEAVSPGRPSWLVPQGTATSLGRASDAEVGARATALRTGPLRVAILAGESYAQVTAATQAVDRWMLRHPAGDRACPQVAAPPAARAGTYTLPLPRSSAASEAWLALPLPDHDRLAFASATWLADALDGAGGLLERSLVSAGLVRSAEARVMGSLVRGRAALVIRLDAPPGSLDAAVAQTRALLDRLREGALTQTDLARASARHAAGVDESRTTPRGRLVELFRERDPDINLPAPSLLAWRAFAASAIKDDALIIAAARPAEKSEPPPSPATSAPVSTGVPAAKSAAPGHR